MDRNENGLLEPDEVPERARMFLEPMARNAGLDPERPMAIEKLRESMQQQWGGRGRRRGGRGRGDDDSREQAPSEPGADQTPGGAAGDGESAGSASASSNPAPKVLGFGVQAKAAVPVGFGVRANDRAGGGREGSQGSEATSRTDGSTSAPGSSRPRGSSRRLEEYADSLIRQNDTNGDGKLQEDEWAELRNETRAADTNGDRVITREELIERLGDFGGERRGSDEQARGRDAESAAGGRPGRGTNRKALRFRTPLERLPKGLPDWFARNDANGDGQVQMSEYASTWTDSKAAEFRRIDRDGDGIITPSECLKADKMAEG
jgi:hypothetical protein